MPESTLPDPADDQDRAILDHIAEYGWCRVGTGQDRGVILAARWTGRSSGVG